MQSSISIDTFLKYSQSSRGPQRRHQPHQAYPDSVTFFPSPVIFSLQLISQLTQCVVEPEHLLLNLRILAFTELCRTIPFAQPPLPLSKKRSSTCLDKDRNSEILEHQTALLKGARKLYALVSMIENPKDKATYLKEIGNVVGLLAYKVPEESTVAKYLSLERREAVADQINAAIMCNGASSCDLQVLKTLQIALAFPPCRTLSYTQDIHLQFGLFCMHSESRLLLKLLCHQPASSSLMQTK
jgi:hypothetical protein